MASLSELLLSPNHRPSLVRDCVQLVDSEVHSKSGLTGVAVKGAYGLVKKIKPGIINEAVDRLIDDFVRELSPYYEQYTANGGGSFSAFLSERSSQVANSLLGVTDRKIQGAQNKTIKKAYEKLRPTGEKHVEAAVPGVGRVVERYL